MAAVLPGAAPTKSKTPEKNLLPGAQGIPIWIGEEPTEIATSSSQACHYSDSREGLKMARVRAAMVLEDGHRMG